jgi:hypothetical protein
MVVSLVPDDFEVPRSFAGHGFQLEPLGPEHNDRDHAAWMSSIEHIRSTPGFDSPDASWPSPMSLEQNLQDLADHAEDFEQRTGFTYSILDGEEVIGCVYIYPAPDPGNDARVRSWVRESRAHMDRLVWRELSAWIRTEWPFSNPLYAPRS